MEMCLRLVEKQSNPLGAPELRILCLAVIQQRGPDTYHALVPIPTREGARNSCFSTQLSQFYLAVPARGDQPAEIRVYQCR